VTSALLISQNGVEIYLIFALYSIGYVKYLERKGPMKGQFMNMHQFGPWLITDHRQMEDLSKIILAFVLRAQDGQ
jgi:hypothetical protein